MLRIGYGGVCNLTWANMRYRMVAVTSPEGSPKSVVQNRSTYHMSLKISHSITHYTLFVLFKYSSISGVPIILTQHVPIPLWKTQRTNVGFELNPLKSGSNQQMVSFQLTSSRLDHGHGTA